MSRSRRKHPFQGFTSAKSEKNDKRQANRAWRRINNQLLRVYDGSKFLKSQREVSNVWDMSKDGKWRFDPEKYPKYLRK